METPRPPYHNEPALHTTNAVYTNRGISFIRRISWGAIFAGTLVSIVAMLLLNLLGIGIGFGSVNPAEESNAFSELNTGALIWWLVSNLVAIFAGGYVAGRLAGVPVRTFSTLHGILSWCLYTLISFWLLTTAIGGLISGVGSIMQKAISIAGHGIEAATDNNNFNHNSEQAAVSFYEIKREVQQVIGDANDPAQHPDSVEHAAHNTASDTRQNMRNESYVSDEDINAIIENVLYEGDQLAEKVARRDVVNVITARTNLSQQEANNIAEVVVRKHQQARKTAQIKGQQLADTASTAAVWSFVALFLGAVVGGIGGGLGKPHDVVPAAGKR